MKKLLLRLFLPAMLVFLLSPSAQAQFLLGKMAKYRFENLFFANNHLEGGWLQLEGKPSSFRKSKLVLGPSSTEPYAQFLCYPKGEAYHIQMKFKDESWGVLEIDDTFKKEGAKVNFVHDDVKGENFIVHPQRFLIQDAGNGYYIRSMDGRYLFYDFDKKVLMLSSKDPSDYEETYKDKQFMWIIARTLF